ncbi:MAG: hypothetical protein Kow0067_11140 [Coriobacteriia bacterium]
MVRQWKVAGATVLAALIVVMLSCTGCVRGEDAVVEADAGSHEATAVPTSAPWPRARSTETSAPPIEMDEYRLPAGAFLKGHASRMAVFHDSNFDGSGGNRIRLLDLVTGEHAVVVPGALEPSGDFTILGVRCSDEWIVWEEELGDVLLHPLDGEWRLWAAPIIPGETPRVGEPVKVRGIVSTAVESRPLFSVVGDQLYYMTNQAPNAKQEGVVRGARIRVVDLGTGEERVVYQTTRNMMTFVVQDGCLVMSEWVSTDSEAIELVVYDLQSERVVERAPLDNRKQVSHYPVYDGDVMAWAELDDDLPRPRLYIKGPDGSVLLLDDTGGDPLLVGGCIVYEAHPRTQVLTGYWKEHAQLRVYDPVTRTRFVLTDVAEGEGWQGGIGIPSSESTLVVSVDTPPGLADSKGTIVRVYHFR